MRFLIFFGELFGSVVNILIIGILICGFFLCGSFYIVKSLSNIDVIMMMIVSFEWIK